MTAQPIDHRTDPAASAAEGREPLRPITGSTIERIRSQELAGGLSRTGRNRRRTSGRFSERSDPGRISACLPRTSSTREL
jgi:hypothetical protein